jgi:hypothetical protein
MGIWAFPIIFIFCCMKSCIGWTFPVCMSRKSLIRQSTRHSGLSSRGGLPPGVRARRRTLSPSLMAKTMLPGMARISLARSASMASALKAMSWRSSVCFDRSGLAAS